ncbi:MAG: hypothetical protein LBQ40_07375 [Clostridiales bacterium]|jgi:hypothetical protein|nr:hypothetical protein [Clostridiales bacterium]
MGYAEYFYLSVLLATVIGGVLAGFKRGFRKSLLKLGLWIVTVLVAVALLPSVLDKLMTVDFSSIYKFDVDGVTGNTLDEILGGFINKYIGEAMPGLSLSEFPGISGLISALPKLLISVVVFGILVAVLNIVFSIVYFILKQFVDNKDARGKKYQNKKILGAFCGGLSGLLSAFIALSPLLGISAMAKGYINDPTIRSQLIAAAGEETFAEIDGFINYDGIAKKIFGAGGLDEEFFDRITRVSVDGGTTVSASDFEEFYLIIGDVMYFTDPDTLAKLQSYQSLSAEELEAVIVHAKSIVSFLFENDVTGIIIDDGLRYLAEHSLSQILGVSDETQKILVESVSKNLIGDGARESVKQAVESLFDFVLDISESAVYLIKNSSDFSLLFATDETPSIDAIQRKAAMFAAISNVVNKAVPASGEPTLFSNVIIETLSDETLDFGNLPDSALEFINAFRATVFSSEKTEAVKRHDLNVVFNFALELLSSDAAGSFLSLGKAGGSTGEVPGVVAELLGSEDFQELLGKYLTEDVISDTALMLVDNFIKDRAIALPIGEFFTTLKGSNENAIAAEFDNLAELFTQLSQTGLLEALGNPSSLASLGALELGDLFLDENGKATIAGRVINAVIVNMIAKQFASNPDSVEYIGILTMPTVAGQAWSGKPWADYTDWTWTDEAGLIAGLLEGLKDLIPDEGVELNQTFEIEIGGLVEFAKIMDALKASRAYYNIYDGIINMVLEATGLGDVYTLEDLNANTSYREVEWTSTFNAVYIAMTIVQSGENDLFDAIADSIAGILENSDEDIDYNAVINALSEDEVTALKAVVDDVINGEIPDFVLEKIAEQFGGVIETEELEGEVDADVIREWLQGFLDALNDLPPTQDEPAEA